MPVGSDNRFSIHPARLVRCQIDGARPDDFRTEHARAAIAGDFSDRFGGDDPAGIETVRSDPVRFILQREHLGQSLDAELRRGIGTSQKFSLFSLRRRNIDDHAASRRPHDLERFPAAQECAVEIGVENLTPDVCGRFRKLEIDRTAARPGEAGVVDHDVQPIEFSQRAVK